MKGTSQNRKNSQEPCLEHLDLETANAASCSDMTGLIPANPSPDDAEAYNDIHGFSNTLAEEIKK